VISIVGMFATLLDAGTSAISPGPKWISVRRSASAARPWRKRKPPRRHPNVDTGAPLEKPSKPLRAKHKIYMPLIVFDRRVFVHAIEE